jgi:hypothetical protein
VDSLGGWEGAGGGGRSVVIFEGVT